MAPLPRATIQALLENIQSLSQRFESLTDSVNQVQETQRELINSLTNIQENQENMRQTIDTLISDQESPAPLQEDTQDGILLGSTRRRDIDRPFQIVNGRRRAAELDVRVIERMIHREFFHADQVGAENAIINMHTALMESVNNLRNSLGVNDYSIPWSEIDRTLQLQAIKDLEDSLLPLSIGLDRCKNSWAASFLMAYKWGYLFQYRKRRVSLERAAASRQDPDSHQHSDDATTSSSVHSTVSSNSENYQDQDRPTCRRRRRFH